MRTVSTPERTLGWTLREPRVKGRREVGPPVPWTTGTVRGSTRAVASSPVDSVSLLGPLGDPSGSVVGVLGDTPPLTHTDAPEPTCLGYPRHSPSLRDQVLCLSPA